MQVARQVASLPVYQVALWPDGWERTGEGAVVVRDTHEIAEARRWYAMAERNGVTRGARPPAPTSKAMRMHGIGVPRSLVDLVGCRFPTEQAASVAIRLIAGDWVEQRRRELCQHPRRMLALREQSWCGSRHRLTADGASLARLVRQLLDLCVVEGLIPARAFRIDVRADDGYGLAGWRCRVRAELDRVLRAQVAEVLGLALIPWNRQVSRDGRPWPVVSIRVEIEPPGSGLRDEGASY